MNDTIEKHLEEEETIVWNGQPDKDIIFTKIDYILIPLGGFFICYLVNELAFQHGSLWLLIILAFCLYVFWGRLITKYNTKKRTYYCITSERIFILDAKRGIVIEKPWPEIDSIRTEIRGNGIGNVVFGEKSPIQVWAGNSGFDEYLDWPGVKTEPTPVFYDMRYADKVCAVALKSMGKYVKREVNFGFTTT